MKKITQPFKRKVSWLKSKALFLLLGIVLPVINTNAQTALPYSQNFEGATHGWTLSNGTQTNQWFVGSAVSNGGTKSLYISNDSGVSNNYDINTTSVVHAYKDFTITPTAQEISLEFDWRTLAESCCDYIRVWIVPTSFTPTVGAQITAATDRIDLFGNLNMDASFKRAQLIRNISAYAVTGSFRLVYEWRNDGSLGTMPGGAIDNINVTQVTCYKPIAASIVQATPTSVNVTVTPNASSSTGVSYEYEVRTSGTQGSGPVGFVSSGASPTANFTVGGLQSGTIYSIYIRTVCGATDKSLYSAYEFVNNPTAIPYTQNFEGATHNWQLSNGTSTNKWVVGTAVNNGGAKSLYVSNDNGVTNNYTITSTSVVHAYKDFGIPANISEITLGFDWRALGESCCDYIRVWLVPSSFTPTVGTQITAANDRVDLFGNMNMDAVFKRQQLIRNITNYTGSFRIVFEWRNDGSLGTMPSGAIDNIEITPVTCSRPVNVDVDEAKDAVTVTVTPDPKSATNVTYQYEVRTSGNAGSGATGLVASGTATTNPFTVSGLQPLTKYTIYIKTVCSPTDSSIWTAGTAFTTLCNYPDLIAAPGKTVCGPQEVDLTAIYDGGTVFWYDDANGTNLVHTGATFTTPLLTSSTSYWVQAGDAPSSLPSVSGAARVAPASGASGFGNTTLAYGVQFNATSAFNIKTVDVYPSGTSAGTMTLVLADKSGNILQTVGPLNIPAGTGTTIPTATPVTIPLNITVPVADTGYRLYVTNLTVPLIRESSGLAFPYPIGTLGSVTAGWASGSASSSTYYYFYNWQIGDNVCNSLLTEVPIIMTPKPAFELSSSIATSCEGGVSAPVTITTNLGGYDTFVWTPSAGVSGDAVNGWTFSSAVEQDYVLSASQSGGICEHLKTVRVFAGKKPEALSTLASTYDLCKNEIKELKALETLPAMVTIGTGLSTTLPANASSAFVQSGVYSKQQYIYSAAELLAQGFNTAGYITNLSFETINSGASLSNPSYTIKMKLTANTAFGTTNFETGNLSTVYSKENHTHTFQGVQTFNFDSPFYWDGQSNVLVEITQEGLGSGNNAETYYTPVTGSNVGIYATSATDANPATGTRTVNRLNTKFGLQQSTVTWSPTSNLYLDAATTIPYTPSTNALKVYVISSLGGSYVYNAELKAPSGCILQKAVTINVTDVVTPIVQGQTFCSATPVSNVVVSGGTGSTYTFYASATSTTPITTISQTGTYYVEASQNLCKSVRIPFTATITPLGLPTAQFTQVVCGGGTVSALMASGVTGSQIKWYDSVTSTVPLAGTQPLVDNTTYYASQSLGNCESGRIAILVDINTAPAALTPQTISICGTLNYGNVNLNQISGSELVWYPSATSQTPIPNTSQIVNGTYYVSQRINGCESLRVQVTASAQGSVPAPTAGIQNICGNGTVAQLVAQILPNATAEWYSSSTSTTPLNASATLVNGTYYLSQRVGNCVSVKIPVAVRVVNTNAPAVSPISMCAGSTVGNLTLPSPTGITYRWYLNSSSTTPLPLTDILQSGYYFVTRIENGCESIRTQVQITINSRPSSPVGATPQQFSDYAEISNLVMNQPNVVWYATYDDAMKGNNPLSQNMPLVHGTTYYAVIIGTNGCPSLPTPIEAIIVLGVNDFDLSKLKYYPNPVSDQLTITYTEVITNVEVFDLNGRMVMKRNFDKETVQLDFSTLSSGTYMLNIKTKENSQFIKIVRK